MSERVPPVLSHQDSQIIALVSCTSLSHLTEALLLSILYFTISFQNTIKSKTHVGLTLAQALEHGLRLNQDE